MIIKRLNLTQVYLKISSKMHFNTLYLIIGLTLLGCNKTSNSTNTTLNSTVIANQLSFSGNGFANNGIFPKLYTCDSLGISPALQWSNAPAGTTNFALTMHHFPPTYPVEAKHVYFVLYNIPASTNSLIENAKTIGLFGMNTVDGKNSYTPPCSQGPGSKTYILTLYALSAAPTISVSSSQVTMDILIAGIRNKILDSTVMTVTYTRP